MGRLKPTEYTELTLPETGTRVTMRNTATYGDRKAAQSAMISIAVAGSNGNGANADQNAITEVEVGAYTATLVYRLIKSWDLEDEDGLPLPVTVENIGRLPGEDGEVLEGFATEAAKMRPPDKPASSASGSSPFSLPKAK